MTKFNGQYNHTIDPKGRLIIPTKFRDVLGDNCIVTKGLDGCLFVYELSEWEKFQEKLNALPLVNKEARKFVRFFSGSAADPEFDKMGRILIPQALREFAKLEKEVVLIGVGNRIEIWDKANYDEDGDYDDMDEISEHMAAYGVL